MNPVATLEWAASLLLLGAVPYVVAHGARAWSQAVSAAHTARAHGISADEAETSIREAREAVATTRQRYAGPTDEDLRRAAAQQVAYERGQYSNGHAPDLSEEYNTSGATDIPDEIASHMSGGEYR